MKKLIPLLIVLSLAFSLHATHNRAGEIRYRHLPGIAPTYEFTIVTYTESASPADRDSLTLDIIECGSGNLITSITIDRDVIIPVGGGIQRNEYTHDSFTFPGPGCYRLTMRDPMRIDGISNITNSVNVPFYIEDTLFITDPQFVGYNSSPILLSSPIDFAATGNIFIHNPAAYDPDGDSLVFSLRPPMQDPNTNVPGYTWPYDAVHQITNPDILSIDPQTGELTWNVAQAIGIYNIAILVREFREGKFIGSLIRDMQIIVIDNPNHPPVLSKVNDTCIIAGALLHKVITASDPDVLPIKQKVTLTAQGGPFFVNVNPATFTTNSPANPVTGIFDWQTTCDHIRPQIYTIVFKAQDNYNGPNGPQPYVDIETWVIRVVAPAPQNLVAVPNGNQVDLSWDSPYPCENSDKFLGFSVWRKRGCDSLVLDTCQAGMYGLGYTRISGPTPIKAYSFTDLNVNSGIVYSYRVVAEFADTTVAGFPYNNVASLPSNESCVEMPRDVPVITHVDVELTDQTAGIIKVRWMKPDPAALDTLINPAPYKYELYRFDNYVVSGPGTLVFQTTASSFSGLGIDSFTDVGLNTLDQPYNYLLRFYATDIQGNFYEVGSAENASSIYLAVTSSGSHLELKWDHNVPWYNYQYVVYKEDILNPGVFDSIATTTQKFYNDYNVVYGKEYCYRIKAYGTYSNPDIPEPLINRSETMCAFAVDTTAPCAPKLTVTNGCDDVSLGLNPDNLYNLLTWNRPAADCGADVMGYRIYYRPTPDQPYALLDTLLSATDTFYLHSGLNSLAGCYVVTAVDSFQNESVSSNEICLDNCPLYHLPNVFTPNGDGANDEFRPFKPYYFVDHIDIKIFNRWGNLVWQTNDPDIHWDGTDINTGEPLNDGVFYYVCDVYEIRLSGIQKLPEPLSGYIHLIRGTK